MTNLTDELKRRARLIAADVVAPHDCALRDNYLSGRADNSPAVRAAIAALRPEPAPDVVEAVQAAIAQQIEKDAGIAERPIMYDYVRIDEAEEWQPGSPYDRGRKEEAERIAAAIRAQKP